MIGKIKNIAIHRIREIKYLYDLRVRSFSIQTTALLIITLIGAWIINNAYQNTAKSNLSLGIGFLAERSGFEIAQGIVPYTGDSSFAMALVLGFSNTLTVAFFGIILATLIGIVIGTGRLSSNKLVSWICRVYVEIFRNIPPLIVIFFWYQAVLSALPLPSESVVLPFGTFLHNRGISFPTLIMDINAQIILSIFFLGIILSIILAKLLRGFHQKTGKIISTFYTSISLIFGFPLLVWGLTDLPLHFDYPVLGRFNFAGGFTIGPEFLSLYIALSCYTASFIAEIVRLGIISIPRGQSEAAMAIGLTSAQATRLVILPQAMRVIIPPLTSQYMNLLKNSSLAVAVGFSDLVSTGGTIINQTGHAIEIVLIWMFVYLSLSITISLCMNWLNNKFALREKT
ncbi:MAG: ABC transporter permease subunit [Candidatus Liberibacter ctenarytainae]|uniref:ABC transporter permease subunit n=1 Tax=Candidatus Liberibacter ctenarytainae TaxID=2020335 RepID=A0A937ASW9_9HYPH|nr:ABC transporter permease subunit [Candidatus Liberibacter ctenarytainae]